MMSEIKIRGVGGSDSKSSAMTCALCSYLSSTYSSIILHQLLMLLHLKRNNYVSIAAVLLPQDVATKKSSCEKSQPSGQSNENLVVLSTVGAKATKKMTIPWY